MALVLPTIAITLNSITHLSDSATFLILVIEDDEDDYYLTSTALQTECQQAQVKRVASLEQWRDYWDSKPIAPSLVLMDFHLPMTTGLELLDDLKRNPVYRTTPVIMWSGTADQDQVIACYEAGAASFIEKPSSMDKLRQNMKALCSFWFDAVRLP